MHRIDVPSATVDDQFTEGSPTGGIPATTVSADWLNDVQEELISILTAAGITPVKGEQDQVLEAIRYLVTAGIGPGAVQGFMRTSAPTGWLKMNGATISRTTYAGLFDVIGTTFGVGDGSTTFGLPDARGEFVRGLDDGRGVDTGRTLGTAQADELKSHVHNIDAPADPTGFGNAKVARGNRSDNNGTPLTAATGGSETRPRNIVALLCIKY